MRYMIKSLSRCDIKQLVPSSAYVNLIQKLNRLSNRKETLHYRQMRALSSFCVRQRLIREGNFPSFNNFLCRKILIKILKLTNLNNNFKFNQLTFSSASNFRKCKTVASAIEENSQQKKKKKLINNESRCRKFIKNFHYSACDSGILLLLNSLLCFCVASRSSLFVQNQSSNLSTLSISALTFQ